MLGSGRPFLVEIQNPRRIPSNVVVKEMETKINNLEHKLVSTCLTAVFAFQSTL